MENINTIEQDIDELLNIHEEDKNVEFNAIPNDLISNDNTSRFSGAEWFDTIKEQKIFMGGCGGIGSNTIFQLARAGVDKLLIYDDDNVDSSNMSGQLFSSDQIGMSKCNAINNTIISFSKIYISYLQSKIRKSTQIPRSYNIYIGGFDNMEARKTMFDLFLNLIKDKEKEEKKEYLFIDGRLTAEYMQVFAMTGDDDYSLEKYKNEYLFDSSEAEETVCSYKQTTFCANMIGSLITNIVVNFCANLAGDERPIPFFTEYDATFMRFNLKD